MSDGQDQIRLIQDADGDFVEMVVAIDDNEIIFRAQQFEEAPQTGSGNFLRLFHALRAGDEVQTAAVAGEDSVEA